MEERVTPGDIIQSRKPHPCGSDLWLVLRTGTDVKLRCQGCERTVLLDMNTFLRTRKKTVSLNIADPTHESCQ